MLKSFGFLELDAERFDQYSPAYLLTLRAFALLEKPSISPEIFISYKQTESSEFASLIEARLTLADPGIGIFIDKVLEGGDEWEKRIKREICERNIFICFYGPTTHKSTMVPKEIDWALALRQPHHSHAASWMRQG